MNRTESIKVLLSILLLISYTVPLIVSKSVDNNYEFIFIDFFYAVGTTLGIGGYLIVDSINLQKPYEYYLISAGIFFVGLSVIFIFDTLNDRTFRTYWYVVFNLLITFIWFILLIIRRHFIRH